jgi:hypothetical protein
VAVCAPQAPGTQGQDARLGGFEVIDHDIEVHLLRPVRVWPLGRLEVRRELESDARGGVVS